MSRDAYFVVVEGRHLDRAFYDRLCRADARIEALGCQVWMIEQVIRDPATGNGAGGKQALLAAHDNCRRTGRFHFSNSQGEHVLMFAADRDYDFLIGGRRRSPYLIYTDMADVESQIFSKTDMAKTLQAILTVDTPTARKIDHTLGAWRKDLAIRWATWLELCCVAAALRARCDVAARKASLVNRGYYGSLDQAKVTQARAMVRHRAMYAGDRVARESRIIAQVRSLFASGDPTVLLKGKLCSQYLKYRLQQLNRGRRDLDLSIGATSYPNVALAYVGFGDRWAVRHQDKIHAALYR